MNDKEFVIWLRGFIQGCHEYAPTPKQWDILKETLSSIKTKDGIEEDEWEDWFYSNETSSYPVDSKVKFVTNTKQKQQLND
jgi:hypothetical protein